MGDKQGGGDSPDFSFLSGNDEPEVSAGDFNFDVSDSAAAEPANFPGVVEADDDSPELTEPDEPQVEESAPVVEEPSKPTAEELAAQKAAKLAAAKKLAIAKAKAQKLALAKAAAEKAAAEKAAAAKAVAKAKAAKVNEVAQTTAAAAPAEMSATDKAFAEAAAQAPAVSFQDDVVEDDSVSFEATDASDDVLTTDTGVDEKPAADGKASPKSSSRKSARESSETDAVTGGVSRKVFSLVAGYAAALTLLVAFLIATGRLSLTGAHPLESLPDIKPLESNEYKQVPADASLPNGHTLTIGQSQRFGDVIFTPVKVTREPLKFVSMFTGAADDQMTTSPVLKLWFEVTNAEDSGKAFPPWDVALMSHRSPAESTDESTKANSFLMVLKNGDETETRVLNYLHPALSNFDITDQNSRKVLQPGEKMTTFVASSPDVSHYSDATGYRWRIQLRKGVSDQHAWGVTTLIDVEFTADEISAAAG
ncbi:MAG: hypothetical protein KDA81_05655 [Planctomycetaceae bacterium]|nr:hypothetical protein [Planctomycetaceae bacterium]